VRRRQRVQVAYAAGAVGFVLLVAAVVDGRRRRVLDVGQQRHVVRGVRWRRVLAWLEGALRRAPTLARQHSQHGPDCNNAFQI